MGLGNLRGDVQSQAEPLLARPSLPAEKRLEQLVHRRFRDFLTLIGDRKPEQSILRDGANDDRLVTCSIRQRIAEEVGEQLAEAGSITVDGLIDVELRFDHTAG